MDTSGNVDGGGAAARFGIVAGLATDRQGNVYVGDSGNRTIRKIAPGGDVSTLAGSATAPAGSDGVGNVAGFFGPGVLATDSGGAVYVADTLITGSSGRTFRISSIRKVSPDGAVSTVPGTSGQFGDIRGIAVDGSGNIYASTGECAPVVPSPSTCSGSVRKIAPGGIVTAVLATAATGPAANVLHPSGLALDGSGDLYVVDPLSHAVNKVTSGGEITLLAGTPGVPGYIDGVATAARFNAPYGIALDERGNVYVADTGNHVIRKIASGMVTTVAGVAGQSGFASGALPGKLRSPLAVAVSGNNPYISQQTAVAVVRNLP